MQFLVTSGLCLISILARTCCSINASSSLGWTLLLGDGVGNQHSKIHSSPSSTYPYPGSRANTATWEDKKGQLWMFGGQGFDENPTDQPETLGDLWRLDAKTLKWKQVESGKVAGDTSISAQPSLRYRPQARSGSALCGVTDTMLILFGGLNNKKEALFDTWIYDVPQSTWLPLFTRYANKTKKASHPKARHDMAFWCSESSLIVYGGRDGKGKDLDDLWMFSLPDLSWKKQRQYVQMDKIPAGAPSQPFPLARSEATTWMNDDDGMVFLYGGRLTNGSVLGDVWSFHVNTSMWTFVADDSARGARSQALMWPGGAGGSVVIFGGCAGSNDSLSPLHDMATFSMAAKTWHTIKANGSYELPLSPKLPPSFINKVQSPSARCRAVTWTRDGQRFLFGGFGLDQMNQLSYLNDLYVLADSQASLTALFEPKRIVLAKASLQLSPRRIFLICFASFGGVVLVFGAVFFFKKMVDFPRHHPTRSYNVKYSQLNDEAMFDM